MAPKGNAATSNIPRAVIIQFSMRTLSCQIGNAINDNKRFNPEKMPL